MLYIFYVLIVLAATVLGAAVGLGGGVIIKPCFDLLGVHDTATIGVYSSMAVFTMSVVAIYRQFKNHAKFEPTIVIVLAAGSILGGITGDILFRFVNTALKGLTKTVQNGMLAVVLAIILIYTWNKHKIRTMRMKSPVMIFLIGFILGNISVFLGIGGGPLNLAVLSFFFSFSSKESTVLSIVIIFFSQLSKLYMTFVEPRFLSYDLRPIPLILFAAVCGGIIGSAWNKRLDSRKIDKLYIGTLALLIGIAVLNMIRKM